MTTQTQQGVVCRENIPNELTKLNQWCVWKGKKVPHSPDTGHPISSTAPADWCAFDDAACEYALGSAYEGVGFCFTPDDPYCGVDLDDCIDADGHLKPWAGKVLALFDACYIEHSPSGAGLHIIVKATKPGTSCKHTVKSRRGAVLGKIEIYDTARYFTVTGRLYDATCTIPGDGQGGIDKLYNGLWPDEKGAAQGAGRESVERAAPKTMNTTKDLDTAQIVSLIEQSSQKTKFRLLTKGSLKEALAPYGDDHSSAVYALTAIVAWYTPKYAVLDEVVRASALYAGKWAPDPKASGYRAKMGKWAALGEPGFHKARRRYESTNNYYAPECERSDPGEDFSDETLDKEQKKGEQDYERHLDLLLELGEPRRDLLSRSLHVKNGAGWEPVFNKGFLGALRGECQARGQAYKKSKIEDYLYRYEAGLTPRLLVDVPAWDGVDRLRQMCQCLDIENVSAEVFEDIFKDWCTKMWGRIANPTKVQNMCILLSGHQGIGKDVWINSIFHSLGQYFSDFSFDGKFTKESEIGVVLAKSLVLFISEFEKTESMDVGMLKDIVTKPTFTSVRKYDRDATTLVNRCSVIGACNPSHIFRDVTGNRRFMFFRLRGGPGQAINWSYPMMDSEHSLRCIAQMKHLCETGYEASRESMAIIKAQQADATPDDPIDDIILDFESAIEAKAASDLNSNRGIYRPHDLTEIFADLARNHSLPRRSIMGILKRSGCFYRNDKCRYYGTRDACTHGKTTVAESRGLIEPELAELNLM